MKESKKAIYIGNEFEENYVGTHCNVMDDHSDPKAPCYKIQFVESNEWMGNMHDADLFFYRDLEDMTDEEAQLCLVEVFNAAPHLAHMEVESLLQFLSLNTEFYIGEAEDAGKPMAESVEFTPQTFFNLAFWLVERRFYIGQPLNMMK